MGFLDWFKSASSRARAAAEAALVQKFTELAAQIQSIKRKSAAKRIAMNLIVPQMAALTIGTYDRTTEQRKKGALHEKLNYTLYGTRMTGYDFWQAFFNNLFNDNNAFARVARVAGTVAKLTPLKSAECAAIAVPGGVQYVVKGKPVMPDEIFHIKQNTYDGLFGVRYEDEVNCFTLAEEAEAMAVRFYENGGNIRRVWKLLPGGTPTQEDEAKAWLESAIKGKLKQHLDVVLPAIIEKAADITGTSFRDGQMVESREFQQKEILALYGVNLDDLDLEQIYQFTIVPLLENVEQAITKQLLTDDERSRYRVKYIIAGRFRGDTAKQYEIAVKAASALTTNEIRQSLGYPPLGKEYDAIINPNTASAGVNEERQQLARGNTNV